MHEPRGRRHLRHPTRLAQKIMRSRIRGHRPPQPRHDRGPLRRGVPIRREPSMQPAIRRRLTRQGGKPFPVRLQKRRGTPRRPHAHRRGRGSPRDSQDTHARRVIDPHGGHDRDRNHGTGIQGPVRSETTVARTRLRGRTHRRPPPARHARQIT